MNIYEKLMNVQSTLKAPKGQRNTFGNYNYRSCEDIVDAVKPILLENKCVLVLNDEVILIGDRYYINSTATIVDIETGDSVQSSALAREEETKKGMDASQITGSASSYARKYALNGLFAIDDEKDADTKAPEESKTPKENTPTDKVTTQQLIDMAKSKNITEKGLINRYKADTGKEVQEVKFIPADVKVKYYNTLKELVVNEEKA